MPEPTDAAVGALAEAMWEAYPRTVAWADVEPVQRFIIATTARQLLGAVYPQIVADVLDHYADKAQHPIYIETPERADIITRWLDARADEVRP